MLLHENDFSFSVLDQHRSGDAKTGISGELLLADNGSEKYVVKYQDPFDAAVEYMAITLATKLRLNCTPEAHLFAPSDRFQHAVGISYLPNLNPPKKKEGILKCIILNFLIANGDHAEYADSDGHIYTLDFAESFCFDFHHKTEEFLAQCEAAHENKTVRDKILPVWKTDYDRYCHMLGYVNEENFYETAQLLAKANGFDSFTPEEVHKEWTHVWRRLVMLKDDAFEELRLELRTVYSPFFAEACHSVLHRLISGMQNYKWKS